MKNYIVIKRSLVKENVIVWALTEEKGPEK